MRRKRLAWWVRLAGMVTGEDLHRRVCRRCGKPILRAHKWHHVKVGWFAPWYCCEHKDCKHPAMETASQTEVRLMKIRLEPELPFEGECNSSVPAAGDRERAR